MWGGVATGRPACQRATRVLRCAPVLRMTRRPSLRSESSYGPCGPAWTGASRPSTTSRRTREEQSARGPDVRGSRGEAEPANAGVFLAGAASNWGHPYPHLFQETQKYWCARCPKCGLKDMVGVSLCESHPLGWEAIASCGNQTCSFAERIVSWGDPMKSSEGCRRAVAGGPAGGRGGGQPATEVVDRDHRDSRSQEHSLDESQPETTIRNDACTRRNDLLHRTKRAEQLTTPAR